MKSTYSKICCRREDGTRPTWDVSSNGKKKKYANEGIKALQSIEIESDKSDVAFIVDNEHEV